MRRHTGNSFIRIRIPHLIEDDEYRCNSCGARFWQDTRICPSCGVVFTGTVTDDEEYEDEEEEMEAWDEEDGL